MTLVNYSYSMMRLTPLGHQAGFFRVARSSEEELCSHLRTNLRKSCSSSRHMLSRLVGEPRANSSGRLDTITWIVEVVLSLAR